MENCLICERIALIKEGKKPYVVLFYSFIFYPTTLIYNILCG